MSLLDGRGLLVHEWIEDAGGSEKVVEAMRGAFPGLDVYCLWADATPAWLDGATLIESWLSRTPLRKSKATALPFMLPTWRHLPGRYDWALVSSHLFAHHASGRGGIAKLVYAHTPARYIWVPDEDERGAGALTRVGSALLKPIDRKRAREIHALAANSEFVRARMQETWKLDSKVIYPPVDSREISTFDAAQALTDKEAAVLASLPDVFLLGASRAVGYKRLDLVIRYSHEAAIPSVIVGSGPELPALRALSEELDSETTFLGKVSDALLRALYQRCLAFVFPPVEDFGIMPVEAMAAGAPVIGNSRGGVAESVVDDETGFLTDFGSSGEFSEKVRAIRPRMRSNSVERALQFDRSVFETNITDWVKASS